MLEAIDPHSFAALVLTGGLGMALVLLGIRANVLEARRERGRCAACGRFLDDGRPCRCRR